MTPNEFFDRPNIIFWAILAVVILVQGYCVNGYCVCPVWPEEKRWRFGYITLFGGTLIMVVCNEWDGPTWAVLALGTPLFRQLLEMYLIGRVWQRRENVRWTTEYFAAYFFVLGSIVLAGEATSYDLVTWGKMFTSLGIAGMMKVGWEATRDSYQSHQIRQMNPKKVEVECGDRG